MVSNKSIISNLFCLFMIEVYEDIQDWEYGQEQNRLISKNVHPS